MLILTSDTTFWGACIERAKWLYRINRSVKNSQGFHNNLAKARQGWAVDACVLHAWWCCKV